MFCTLNQTQLGKLCENQVEYLEHTVLNIIQTGQYISLSRRMDSQQVRHESTHHNPTEVFLQSLHNPLIPYIRFPSALSPHCYKSRLILAHEIQLSKASPEKIVMIKN